MTKGWRMTHGQTRSLKYWIRTTKKESKYILHAEKTIQPVALPEKIIYLGVTRKKLGDWFSRSWKFFKSFESQLIYSLPFVALILLAKTIEAYFF